MSHVCPVTILISGFHYHKLHNGCRIVVPWPLISGCSTFPLLFHTPPLPQLYPRSSPHLTLSSLSSSLSTAISSLSSSFGNLSILSTCATVYRIFISSIIFRVFFVPSYHNFFPSPSVPSRVLGLPRDRVASRVRTHPRFSTD